MPNNGSIKVNGVWKTTSSWYVKVNGVWRTVSTAYVKVDGAWRSYITVPTPAPTPAPAPSPGGGGGGFVPVYVPTPTYVAPVPVYVPIIVTPTYIGPAPGYTPPTPFVDPYYGVGNPCIQGDTLVLAYENGEIIKRPARDIKLGDQLVSLNFSEIDFNDPIYNMWEWNTETLSYVDKQIVTVMYKTQSIHGKVAYFNGNKDAKFSEYHPFLVKRDGTYEFYMVCTLLLGDTIFVYDDVEDKVVPIVLDSIDWVEGATDAYNFDVEDYDLVIAGGYITHNK